MCCCYKVPRPSLVTCNVTTICQVIQVLLCCTNLVLHPVPGGKLTAKIRDSRGVEVPKSDYDLVVNGEDLTFKFKKPHRSRSGRYTIVFSYEGVDIEKDIMVNFRGELEHIPVKH